MKPLTSETPLVGADRTVVGELLAATAPLARTLDLRFLGTTPERAVRRRGVHPR